MGHLRPRDGPKGFAASDPRIAPYVESLLEPEDELLREIRGRSAAEGLPPIAIGPFDGRHLEVLARMADARRIVEIGTLGGYSGVCDNVFRRAAVPVENDPPEAGAGIRAFDDSLARSGRFRATLLPLEDGFAVGVKLR